MSASSSASQDVDEPAAEEESVSVQEVLNAFDYAGVAHREAAKLLEKHLGRNAHTIRIWFVKGV